MTLLAAVESALAANEQLQLDMALALQAASPETIARVLAALYAIKSAGAEASIVVAPGARGRPDVVKVVRTEVICTTPRAQIS